MTVQSYGIFHPGALKNDGILLDLFIPKIYSRSITSVSHETIDGFVELGWANYQAKELIQMSNGVVSLSYSNLSGMNPIYYDFANIRFGLSVCRDSVSYLYGTAAS